MVDRLKQMRHNPAGDWRLSDIEAICKEFGIDCRAPRGGGSHYKVSCSIPDDCIDPRRMPLFISRGFLRDLMSTLEPRQIEEESQ